MNRGRKIAVIILVLLVLLSVLAYLNQGWIERQFFRPTNSSIEKGIAGNSDEEKGAVKIVAQNLTVPWRVAFLPEGDILLAERSGTLRRVKDGKMRIIEQYWSKNRL
jgi:glucose/arabinose dehydrogenase